MEVLDLHECRQIVVAVEWLVQRSRILRALTHYLKTQQTNPDNSFHFRVGIENVEEQENGQFKLAASLTDECTEVLVTVHGLPE